MSSQLAIDFDTAAARAGRDDGMKRALDHADEETPTWSTVAFNALRLYAMRHAIFMAEDVREWAHSAELGLAMPPDGRAWGGVVAKAKRDKLMIDDQGYAPMKSKNCHANPKRVWRSLIFKTGTACSNKS